jgi:hypothetical protein
MLVFVYGIAQRTSEINKLNSKAVEKAFMFCVLHIGQYFSDMCCLVLTAIQCVKLVVK